MRAAAFDGDATSMPIFASASLIPAASVESGEANPTSISSFLRQFATASALFISHIKYFFASIAIAGFFLCITANSSLSSVASFSAIICSRAPPPINTMRM